MAADEIIERNENEDSEWDEEDEAWLREILASESKAEYVQRMRKHFLQNDLPLPDCMLDSSGADV